VKNYTKQRFGRLYQAVVMLGLTVFAALGTWWLGLSPEAQAALLESLPVDKRLIAPIMSVLAAVLHRLPHDLGANSNGDS
jgi:hypothetical protein